jgi:hypothetical protein
MLHWMSLAFSLFVFSSTWAARPSVVEENLYLNFQAAILSNDKIKINSHSGMSSFEQSLFVDALWDLAEEGATTPLKALNSINTFHFDLAQKLRTGILKIRFAGAENLPPELVNELMLALQSGKVELKILYLLASYESIILKAGHEEIISLARGYNAYYDIIQDKDETSISSDEVVTDLFYNTPDITTYMNGEYASSVKIFMFCRENRLYPCMMIMKDTYGQPVRNNDGSLWMQPSLGSSSKGLPSYYRNGNTPTGVYTIDSVMPYTDQVISFGKFRRMILNFIPKSKNEILLKSLLPTSSHSLSWWKNSIVARDAGRNLFRIHGTGKINTDPDTPYFPFMRTSGCVAQRENSYEGVTYRDQRLLLDKVMQALDLDPMFDNEPKIKGILYVIDLDDKDEAVGASDLHQKGIE